MSLVERVSELREKLVELEGGKAKMKVNELVLSPALGAAKESKSESACPSIYTLTSSL